ncbi:hypothetical protein FJU11_10785 [Pararhizobium mangrovi]|uniref:Transposase zinc-binding domain-containing protein n=1 Tax=Pararhizobium mangrovi TaxID=2590452 RepID=A0A506U0B8_9HYPH|nr:hypothetical protein FJU11_10785 [Pararhizobium mangrovi]
MELADIFRISGPDFRAARAGHLSLSKLKVMSEIEASRTAALGGHVEGCDECDHWRIAYPQLSYASRRPKLFRFRD